MMKVEGIGEDFVPRTLDSQIVDEWIRITDAESFYAARAMARKEGLLLGGSAGTNVAAAIQYARRLGPNDLIVVIGCDTGRNYLSKFYDDNWMRETGLLKDDPNTDNIGDMIKKRGDRPLISIAPDATVNEAIDVLQKRGISQMPVLQDGVAQGSIQEITLARFLHEGHDPNTSLVKDVMAKPLPQMDLNTHIDEAFRLLQAGNTGVLATSQGKVVDIVTRIDFIHYWNMRRKG